MTCCGRDMVGVEVRGLYDGVLFYECACGRKVHRFPALHRLHDKAESWAKQYAVHIEERP